MEYTVEIHINLPRSRVVELFDNPDNLKHWQKGLISFEPIEGSEKPGTPGAKSLIKYEMGRRKMEMIETITVRNLPEEFSGTYETKGVWNEVSNYFIEVDENTTIWKSKNIFKMDNFFMRMFALLMPGAFKKQSMEFLIAFKKFAENQ